MSIKAYIGSFNFLWEKFIENIKKNKDIKILENPFCIITPNRFINAITKYRTLQYLPQQSAVLARFITFGHLINELYFKYSTETKIYVDSSYLLSFLFNQYLKKDKNQENKIQSLVDAILEKEENLHLGKPLDNNTLDELKNVIMPDEPESLNENILLGYDIKNLEEVINASIQYQDFLQKCNFMDRKDIYKCVYKILTEGKPKLDLYYREFSFWGFSYFSTMELDIIRAMIELVVKDNNKFNIFLYFLNQKVIDDNINKFFKENMEEYRSYFVYYIGQLAENISENSTNEDNYIFKKVEIISTQDNYDEVWCCAKVIRKLLDNKVNPVDVCVVIPPKKKYIDLCGLLFKYNFIPVNNFLKSSLYEYPLTQFILKIHKILSNELMETSDLIALLSSPYCKFYKLKETLADIQKMLDTAKIHLIYTLDDWFNFISTLDNKNNTTIAKFFKLINALRSELYGKKSRNKNNWQQFVKISKKIIKQFITKKLTKDEKLLLIRLEEALNFFRFVVKNVTKEISTLEDYIETMEKYFQTQYYPVSIEHLEGINLITYDLLSYSKFEYIFFLGLDFNEFDSGYMENPFFTDRVKTEINRILGTFLKTKSFSLNCKIYTMLNLIENATKSYLLYKRLEFPDKNLAPSKIIYILDKVEPRHISKFPTFINQEEIKNMLCNDNYDLLSWHELQIISDVNQNNIKDFEQCNSGKFAKNIFTETSCRVTDFIEIISCPKKFFYKILLEQKGNNKQKLSIFLSQDELGTLIHKVIGDYIKFIGQNSNKNIWTDGFDKIIRNAINNNSYLFDFRRKNLRELYIQYLKIILEEPCKKLVDILKNAHKLESEKEVEGFITFYENILGDNKLSIKLKGKIDLVMKLNKEYTIIDYKSSSTLGTAPKETDKLQLYLYSKLLKNGEKNVVEKGILRISTCPEFFSKNSTYGKRIYTIIDDKKVENDIKEVLRKVLKYNYFYLDPDEYNQCKFCDYKYSCGRYIEGLIDDIK